MGVAGEAIAKGGVEVELDVEGEGRGCTAVGRGGGMGSVIVAVVGVEVVDPTSGIVDVGSHRVRSAERGREGTKWMSVGVGVRAVWRMACHERATGKGFVDEIDGGSSLAGGTSSVKLDVAASIVGNYVSCCSRVNEASW